MPTETATFPPMTNADLDKLAHCLAYEGSVAVIDGCCAANSDELEGEPGPWFNLDDTAEFAGEDIAKAAQYLDARGLIIRHPKHDNWIQIHDESEATR